MEDVGNFSLLFFLVMREVDNLFGMKKISSKGRVTKSTRTLYIAGCFFFSGNVYHIPILIAHACMS